VRVSGGEGRGASAVKGPVLAGGAQKHVRSKRGEGRATWGSTVCLLCLVLA